MRDGRCRTLGSGLLASFPSVQILCCGLLLASSTARADLVATVDVDFGTTRSVHSQAGILQGMDGTIPTDSKIVPIALNGEYARIFTDWSYSDAGCQRALDMGYRLIVRLDSYPRMTGKYPYENGEWTAWEQWVRAQAQKWGLSAVYDVWNEPNLIQFWPGTQTQYFATYVGTYAILKDELGPGVEVTGPSSYKWDASYIGSFLDYCLANDAAVPVLNWHELNDSVSNIPAVRDHLVYAAANWKNNSSYAALNIDKIVLGETVGSARSWDPGSTLGYFYYLEQGASDGACNSCWDGDCPEKSLSGLLNGTGGGPRAVWWVFEKYTVCVRGRCVIGF